MLAMPGLRTGKLALDTFELFRQLLTEQRPIVGTILTRGSITGTLDLCRCLCASVTATALRIWSKSCNSTRIEDGVQRLSRRNCTNSLLDRSSLSAHEAS